MKNILNDESFLRVDLIYKGWSNDKKYYAETKNGEKLLLRISEYEHKKYEFEMMNRISESGIKMSKPIDFGICKDRKSVYQILTWCEGEEAKALLPSLSEKEQYEYGLKAAAMIKRMEEVDKKLASDEWAQRYKQRVERYIQLYSNCGYRFDGDEVILSYLEVGFSCIGERPMGMIHEDFQTDNMVISPDGELYVIDFQLCGMVDPYYAMMSVGVSAMYSVCFARGQMEGYSGKNVPTDFWEKYNYYMLTEMLYTYTVAVTMDEERAEAGGMFVEQVERIKNGASFIPQGYRESTNYKRPSV